MLSVPFIVGVMLVPYLSKLPKYLLSYSQSTDLLASFFIISAASPSATHPKIMELCNHTAQASAHYACAEDGYIKFPHLPIIDGINWVDWWLVVGWIWGRQTSDMRCT